MKLGLLEHGNDRGSDGFGFGHAANALGAAAEPAFLGIDKLDAVFFKLREVALNLSLIHI